MMHPADVQAAAQRLGLRFVPPRNGVGLGGELGGFSLSKLLGKAGDVLGQFGGAVGDIIGGNYSGAAQQVIGGLVNVAQQHSSAGRALAPIVQSIAPQILPPPQQPLPPPPPPPRQGIPTSYIVAGAAGVVLLFVVMRRRR